MQTHQIGAILWKMVRRSSRSNIAQKQGEYGDLADASSDLQGRVLCESSNRRSRSSLTMRSDPQTTTKKADVFKSSPIAPALSLLRKIKVNDATRLCQPPAGTSVIATRRDLQ